MKIIGLDNKEYSWNLSLYVKNQRRGCSDYHKRARNLLKQIFPFDQILEEVPIPSTSLFADFFIPKQMKMVEVQGEQHTNYTPFFHKDKRNFGKAKLRDKTKKEWCELNGIELIELSYAESDIEWQEKIWKQ